MIKSGSITTKHIILCQCRGGRIGNEIYEAIDQQFQKMSAHITKLDDLCGLVASKGELLPEIFKEQPDALVIGCYPRTMKLLIGQIPGDPVNTLSFRYLNLIDSSPEDALEQINSFCPYQTGNPEIREIREDTGWQSWFPVIDYSRCTSCSQCADFCLFGVYDKTLGKITVVNPKGCKDQCPACARICPATAIIFPKYKRGGAVGGSDDIDEKAELQRQTRDIESILGEDIYLALQKRKAKRQSIIKEEEMKKAFRERDNAINKDKSE